MKRSIQKVDKCLSMIENAVIILGLSAMFLILLAQVIMRYVFSRPLTWSEEAARFIFVYVSFIGISYAYRQKGHIRMEVVVNLFPQAVRRGLEVLINLGTIALFCYMIPFSFRFIGIQAPPGSPMPVLPSTEEQRGLVSSSYSLPSGHRV